MLRAATNIDNIVENEEYFFGQFGMPQNGDTLYMIWDLRDRKSNSLSFSTTDEADACCGYVCNETYSEYEISSSEEQVIYFDYIDNTDTAVTDTISPGEKKIVCSANIPSTQGTFENVNITFAKCGCS